MITAIATDGPDSTSKLSRRGARAGFFLIFGDAGRLLRRLKNPYKEAKKNISQSVSSFLMQHDVEMVVASGLGTKFSKTLDEHGIQNGIHPGNVKTARNKYYQLSIGVNYGASVQSCRADWNK